MSTLRTTIPIGSWILVTGVTGFVASQLAKEVLERGYKVRGTVREARKAAWLVDDVLQPWVKKGDFELAIVSDFSADNAFDEAIRGVSAVAHVASIGTFDPDPNKVVPQTVAGTLSALEAAMKEPSVQQFVYTSSKATSTMSLPGDDIRVERDTWNDLAVKLAWEPPPYTPSRGLVVYMASKVAAEKEVWKFAAERKPHFAINVVSPAGIIGEPLNKKSPSLSASWVPKLFNGETSHVKGSLTRDLVDVKDVVLLHVAAILDPEVENARLQAWGHRCNWNDVLAIMRELRPQHQFVPDFPNCPDLKVSTDPSAPLALLKKWSGQDGWRPLSETVADNLSICE